MAGILLRASKALAFRTMGTGIPSIASVSYLSSARVISSMASPQILPSEVHKQSDFRCHAQQDSFPKYNRSVATAATLQMRAPEVDMSGVLEPEKMFCYQCEQTSKGTGCTSIGVCGKTPEVSGMQDLLIYSLKGLAGWADHAYNVAGIEDLATNQFILASAFSTLTNVNFDAMRFQEYITKSHKLQLAMQKRVADAGAAPLVAPPAGSVPGYDIVAHPFNFDLTSGGKSVPGVGELIEASEDVGLLKRGAALGNATLLGLQELLTYGIKGTAAYAHHAEQLGFTDPDIYRRVNASLAFLATEGSNDLTTVLGEVLKMGETNLIVMKLLDEAHTTKYGHPVPTQVSTSPIKGKALLVTGHDMADLEAVLEQSAGKGINVYTHGEMLPGHSYPGLKDRFPHLVGHFGGAWYKQKIEFDRFPGSVLVTTNCVLDPLSSYRANMFTTGETGVTGVQHVSHRNFGPVIQRALELPGFLEDQPPSRTLTVGFGHNAVLAHAGEVIDAVKTGKLQHIFLIGGCDGSEPQRRYYKNLGKEMPTNTMVLTLGCGKFRLLDQDWGMIPGTDLPRLLDMGQCNDAYSALVVATELAKAFNTDVNGLPLSLDLSWFEQKAVAVLLTLLHLGVKNIRLGPRLPAFLTPDAVQVLVDKFGLKPADINHPDQDITQMIAQA